MARKFINYDKPGKGVSKSEIGNHGFLNYFAVYFRKFWSLAFVNVIFLILFIPIALACAGLVRLAMNAGYSDNSVILLLCFLPTILLGPANAGLSKITRDFAREEPCFVWQDFWESIKLNFKQSLFVGIFGYIGTSVFIMVISFYYGLMNGSFIMMLPFAFSVVLAFLFLSILGYLQLMVVTLDLKLKMLLKNAAILSIGALGKNFLAVLVNAVFAGIFAVIFYFSLNMMGVLILLVMIFLMVFFALLSYTTNYILFPVISKYIIEPYYAKNPEKTVQGVFDKIENGESGEDAEEAELPEYVYENGRMVHRSVIENRALFDDKGRNDDK